jgi:hypothetical protein
MDLDKYVLGGFVLIGLVNGIQFVVDKDWKSFIKFATAVLFGGLFGYLQWFGIPSLEIGLALGLSSSGVYKLSQKLGGE